MDAASIAITEMGGKVAKKLGDGLMALFAARVPALRGQDIPTLAGQGPLNAHWPPEPRTGEEDNALKAMYLTLAKQWLEIAEIGAEADQERELLDLLDLLEMQELC